METSRKEPKTKSFDHFGEKRSSSSKHTDEMTQSAVEPVLLITQLTRTHTIFCGHFVLQFKGSFLLLAVLGILAFAGHFCQTTCVFTLCNVTLHETCSASGACFCVSASSFDGVKLFFTYYQPADSNNTTNVERVCSMFSDSHRFSIWLWCVCSAHVKLMKTFPGLSVGTCFIEASALSFNQLEMYQCCWCP